VAEALGLPGAGLDPREAGDQHLGREERLARRLRIALDRFQRDRRSDPVAERVRRDFRSGISAGVTATPAGFASGTSLAGELVGALRGLATR
jgi:hypothetical protein